MGGFMITRSILIEDIVHEYPVAVEYLMRQGIKCLACGEPLWGTLESVAREKGFGEEEIDRYVAEISELIRQKTDEDHAHSHR